MSILKHEKSKVQQRETKSYQFAVIFTMYMWGQLSENVEVC